MPSTFRLPNWGLRVQIALARARCVARSNFRQAVAYLVGAMVTLDNAIAIVARLCGAAAARAAA